MTKQFRLVTEKEYATLQSLREAPSTILPAAPTLIEEKQKVLLSDFPEEVKNMLYQDFVRRMLRKRQEEENKPILVKNISPPSSVTTMSGSASPPSGPPLPSTPRPLIAKRNLLSDFFQQHGNLSSDSLLVFGGKKLTPGQTGSVLRALTDGRVNENIEGFNEAIEALREKNVPLNYLAPARHIHFQREQGASRQIRWTKMIIPN
jgi:hypothetical protein